MDDEELSGGMEMKPLSSLQKALAQPVRMFMLDFHLSILDDLVGESNTILRYAVLSCALLSLYSAFQIHTHLFLHKNMT